ncbi:uncharacterized protein LOC142162910 [Nicotiana tabacum]|uniref:Uncharacterized protein LOC142162910 n=1 Tax=Nicotiana tabacum TaxID=4097 RepID=A0AC58RTR5_TOBAC
MKIALLGKRKLGFVNGTCTNETYTSELHKRRETCNAIVLSWLMNIVSTELLSGIAYATNAHLSLWNEYDAMVTTPNSKDYVDHMQQQRLLQFLSGLNDSARRQILLKTSVPSFNQAYAMIIEDETHNFPSLNEAGIKSDPIVMQISQGQGYKGNRPFMQCTIGSRTQKGGQYRRPQQQQALATLNNMFGNSDVPLSNSEGKESIADAPLRDKVSLPTGDKVDITYTGQASIFKGEMISNDLCIGRVKEIGKESAGLYIFQDLGIVHQSSCVRTPQQNDIVERKHRHILDVARALRFQANLPIRYWGLCVQAVVYVLNKLPSTAIQGKKATSPSVDQHASDIVDTGNTVDVDAVEDLFLDSLPETNSPGESHDVLMDNLPNFGVGEPSHTCSRDFAVAEADTSSTSEDPSTLRKSKRQCIQPIWMKDYAAKDERWIEAIKKESKALDDNHTWEVVLLPQGKYVVRSKWVYKIMYHANGKVERFMARLVLRGYSQQEGFVQSTHDYSLFTLKKQRDIVIILVYVNDLLITGSNLQLITEAKQILH